MVTKKQAKLIELKAKGLTSRQIADEVGLKSATDVRIRLNKPNIKAALYKEMQRQGLTLDKVIAPIAKGIQAQTKRQIGEVVTETDDKGNPTQKEYIYAEEDNLPLQMQASDRAVKLLGLDKVHEEASSAPEKLSKEDIEALSEASDEVVLTQLLFRKS